MLLNLVLRIFVIKSGHMKSEYQHLVTLERCECRYRVKFYIFLSCGEVMLDHKMTATVKPGHAVIS